MKRLDGRLKPYTTIFTAASAILAALALAIAYIELVDDEATQTITTGPETGFSVTTGTTTTVAPTDTTEATDTSRTDFSDNARKPEQPPAEGDPVLVGLASDCYLGDMQACDDLFNQSPEDSALFDYGDLCGRRFDQSKGWCVQVLPELSDDPHPPEAPPTEGDASLVGLASDCYRGDMQACDDLFMESTIDSVLEEYGDLCGHRFDQSHGWCTATLPDPPPPPY